MSSDSRFSPLALVVALVTVGAGAAVGLRFVPTVGTYLGMLVGGLVAGLVLETRPTVESGVAAVVAGFGLLLAATLPGNGVLEAALALGSTNPLSALVGAALNFAIGAFGGHFGDDLRDGLTEPLPEPTPATSGSRSVERAGAGESVETTDEDEAADRDSVSDAGERAEVEDVARERATESADGSDAGSSGFDFDDDAVEADEEREYELE